MKNLLLIIASLLIVSTTFGQVKFNEAQASQAKTNTSLNDLGFTKSELKKIQELSLEEFTLIKDLNADKLPMTLRASLCINGTTQCATANWPNWTCAKLNHWVKNHSTGWYVEDCKDTNKGIEAVLRKHPSKKLEHKKEN